ncbi:unnamed protein product [Didymodactylos carnosus]|uniref:JmjC domain-containing protein n=1 Tax=Didymodactylos carnosus TaxID=1234261 RepID=A0A8S2HM75_9BILA|nr:unnamed protein product [Didymodactylos carnosus]CAF3661724.1 unnamed protein product [Didymodactylos carnosus]
MDNYNSLNKQVPVLYPTYEEFKNLSAYIISQEQRIIQSQFGAFKIVPPFRWVPVTNCFSSIRIKSYLTQRITPSSKVNHVYQIKNIITTKRRAMFYEEFKRLAESEHHHLSDSIDDVEEYFWKSIHEQTSTMHPPIYAADINSSLFSKKETICSFSNLKSLLNYYPLDIKDRLENFVNDNNLIELSGDEKLCTAPIQHKTLLIHPNLLIQNNIDCHQIIQKQNEIVCILPRSYHFGFNCGLNIAEAINYALPSWINYGMKTKICSCVQPVVKLDMQHFTTDIVDKFEQDIGKTKLPLTNFSFSQQPTDPITHVSDLFVGKSMLH